ncbi:glutathione S-transferase C-terminal domain-containing protein isoform X4 [Corythoichthys intestinalis]|uniref:glutathione S-transferase C-terminal domain-containing protein isoform X4 n=1 Tax=Corythoichthys intestinalis TaxID=161448 RepID=UPI0025A658F0|nr:glutathione S-transferase C-terminal domain-containing protein isoform X4 [Corythoichthys intestinalis]
MLSMKDLKQRDASLFLEVSCQDDSPSLPLHSSIVLFLLSYCECKSFKVHLVSSNPHSSQTLRSQLPEFLDVRVVVMESLPLLVQGCRLPAVLDESGRLCRAGLAVVLRHIINKSIETEPSRNDVQALLGFKKTCLKACAESSIDSHAASTLQSLPHLLGWYSRVQKVPGVLRAAETCGIKLIVPDKLLPIIDGTPAENSPAGHLEQEEETSKQLPFVGGPRPTITKLKESGIEAAFSDHPCPEWSIPWDSLPEAINPTEGKMSNIRTVRKRQQLNNLVAMVTQLAKPGCTVVDFCSGTGHVGIVLAHALPQCQVILIENKEESLIRAHVRSAELGLENIGFIQANLDYFTGPFHVGVALHACGVATDMVMEHCIQARAAFVISPCCYGFIQNAVKFTFPRSKKFQDTLTYKEHMILCRFADQTALQLPPERRLIGKQCMGLVDLDRSWSAESHGYRVRVMTMEPETCSPKNNMLVGRPSWEDDRTSTCGSL